MRFVIGIVAMLGIFNSQPALANAYSCAKMIYKDGWLKSYEYLGNTFGANTKKHGAVSSTTGALTENLTSTVDPGVYTGKAMSSVQYSSSWGDCSLVEYHITKRVREDYIEQNMQEIKKQIALGAGYHVDSLAVLSGCRQGERVNWSTKLQSRTADFYDSQNGPSFTEKLDALIASDELLKLECHPPTMS